MNRLQDLLLRAARQEATYYLLAWAAALIASAVALISAWHAFDSGRVGNERRDGNGGHATIDFGGQWLMGRMLVTGHGRQLYDRNVQREVLRPAYPDADHEPGKSDVESLMYWFMGHDDPKAAALAAGFVGPLAADGPLAGVVLVAALSEDLDERAGLVAAKRVGGPLYPPVNAFVYAPLGLVSPRVAYRIQQVVNVLLTFFVGLGLSTLARGRIWCPAAAVALMLFPGFGGSVNLGQNATLTLAILVWGWALVARGRPACGGAVWGLLAFKPVWALAFFLVPVLTRRWRFGLAMIVTGTMLALATLPVVGVAAWFDWLRVGHEAARLYNVEENWIFLSRDLLSVPRRWTIDFKDTPIDDRDKDGLAPTFLGWGLLVLVLEVTVRLAVLRRREAARAVDGPPAAFLLLGAWMGCFHFMYYDVLLAALPVFLLFTEPSRYLQPLLLAVVPLRRGALPEEAAAYHRPAPPPRAMPTLSLLSIGYQHVWVLNRLAPTAYVFLVATQYLFPHLRLGSHWGPPWDTFCLIALWLWCGWQWLCHGEKVATNWSDPA